MRCERFRKSEAGGNDFLCWRVTATERAGCAGGVHRSADVCVRAQDLRGTVLPQVPESAGVGGTSAVELAHQSASAALRHLQAQNHSR